MKAIDYQSKIKKAIDILQIKQLIESSAVSRYFSQNVIYWIWGQGTLSHQLERNKDLKSV